MLDSILGFIGKGIDAFSSHSATDKKIAAEKELQAQNIANQKEFAQQGIRWKVADAQAAGLHPLAALGAQTSSFSNVVGGNYDIPKTDFGGMGQDIGRAITAGSSQTERSDRMGAAIARTAQVFSLEKMNLENELLKSSIAKERATTPPPISGLIPLPRPGPQRAQIGDPVPVEDDKLKQKAGDIPAHKQVTFAGIPLNTNPRYSDADTLTGRYGESEILEMAIAAANLYGDVTHTYGNPWQKYQDIITAQYGPNFFDLAQRYRAHKIATNPWKKYGRR